MLDIGSRQVEANKPTYASLFNHGAWRYEGLDIKSGMNVNIVVEDPYDWPDIPDDSYDVVISGQALEHIEFFWGTAFEIGRVMKPGGLAALIMPSGGPEHRYPLDCWRFYRDGMIAIAHYLDFDVLDVFTDIGRGIWQDSMIIMQKPVWAKEEWNRFRDRARVQRFLLGCSAGESQRNEFDPPSPSPLAAVKAGLVAPVLESIREPTLADGTNRSRKLMRKVSRLAKFMMRDGSGAIER